MGPWSFYLPLRAFGSSPRSAVSAGESFGGFEQICMICFSADTGKLYFTHPHPQAVTALACNGAMIISGSSDGTLDYYWMDEVPLVLF